MCSVSGQSVLLHVFGCGLHHIVFLQLSHRTLEICQCPQLNLFSLLLSMKSNIYCTVTDKILVFAALIISVFPQCTPPAPTRRTRRTTMTQELTLQALLSFTEEQHGNKSTCPDAGCSQLTWTCFIGAVTLLLTGALWGSCTSPFSGQIMFAIGVSFKFMNVLSLQVMTH